MPLKSYDSHEIRYQCRIRSVAYLASFNISVRYLGARSIDFFINAACCSSFSSGGGVVRVATGVPTALKNSSWPAGEQTQSILTGREEELWN